MVQTEPQELENKRPLNILVIAPNLPFPPDYGGAVRMYNLYRRLGQRHRITWLAPIWEGAESHIQGAEAFCERVLSLPRQEKQPFPAHGWQHWLFRVVAHLHWERLFVYCYGYVQSPGLYWLPVSPERLTELGSVLASAAYDLIVCEGEGNAELLPSETNLPAIISLQNIQSMLFQRFRGLRSPSWENRLFYYPELIKIVRYEKRNYTRFQLGITVSEEDKRLLHHRCPHLRTTVIQNGVDVKNHDPEIFKDISQDPNTLLYFGHYGYPPNVDAVLYFCREILPLIRQNQPETRLLVMGRNPPAELASIEAVQLLGFTPDTRPYLAQASVVISPLRMGGGTRLKILEAMGMGKAIVSTTIGAEGIQATSGADILLADTPRSFADAVLYLLSQPEQRLRLGQNARMLVKRIYDWDLLAEQLDSAFTQTALHYRPSSHP